MLHEFILAHRAELIELARARVAKRIGLATSVRALASGAPLFIEQLAHALLHPLLSGESEPGSMLHGATLYTLGYTLAQVVHDYGDTCIVITHLVQSSGAVITPEEFQILHLCLENAVAAAVAEHSRLGALASKNAEAERSGVFAHELRNRLCAVQLGFQSIKGGTAPVSGSISALMTRNLQSMEALISRSLLDVRIDSGICVRRRTRLYEFIEEAEVEARIAANVRGLSFGVEKIDHSIDVHVDPQILAGVLANLLQNAFKFTPKGGSVLLQTSILHGRVLIDVTDGCGGLPPGKTDALFTAFEQRGADRTGLGLGLFISRKGAEASGGGLQVRDLPGVGCVFTIDLPQLH